jgi:hypothetical protein
MTDHTSVYLILGGAVFLVLVIEPLRLGAFWLITSSWKPVLGWVKVVLHFLFGAHMNVLRNFQPRQNLVYELDRKRTSHTGNE